MTKQMINPTLAGVLLLGFSSGLPLSLTSTTLQAWFTDVNIDTHTIAMLTLLGLPYSFKFLWAPFLDNFTIIPGMRRKSWILVSQSILVIGIAAMAFCSPSQFPNWTSLIALMVVFASATQDIAIDGWRTEILTPPYRGLGAAFANGGYRAGMMASGGLALIFADYIGWQLTFIFMSVLMGVNLLITLVIPDTTREFQEKYSLKEYLVSPFKEFFSREHAFLWLFFVILYKICDAFVTSLTPVFLIRELGFTLSQVGMATKFIGIFAILAGVFVGGVLLIRIHLFTALLVFGILQALSTLLFAWLAILGKNFALMFLCIFAENFCVGLFNAAFAVLLMALCNIRYAATQFAFFSALAVLARSLAGPLASLMVESGGWVNYFAWTSLMAVPGLLLLWYLKDKVDLIHAQRQDEKTILYQS